MQAWHLSIPACRPVIQGCVQLNGTLPSFQGLSSLTSLDLSSNKLAGSVLSDPAGCLMNWHLCPEPHLSY